MSINSNLVSLMVAPGTFVLEQRSIPGIDPDSVLVRVLFCGICGTDVSIYEGVRKTTFPYSPGHEYIGVVEALGSNVRHLTVGDRVTVNPNNVCGRCYYCRHDEFNLCESADVRVASNGGFAEHVLIDGKFVYRLPDAVNDESAALIEPLACCIHVLNNARPGHRHLVAIIGGGTIGLLLLQVMIALGPPDAIVVSDPLQHRRDTAIRLGATVAVDPMSDSLRSAIEKVAQEGADLVFECSGASLAIEDALKLPRRGGELVLVGRPEENLSVPLRPYSIAKNEICVRGSSRFVPSEFETAIQWMATGEIGSAHLIDSVFPLHKIKAAFDHARSGAGIKTLVQCSQDNR